MNCVPYKRDRPSICKMSWKCAVLHRPACREPRSTKLSAWRMKFGVTFFFFPVLGRVILFPEAILAVTCVACTQRHCTHRYPPLHSSYLLSPPAGRPPAWTSAARRRLSSPGVSTSPSGIFLRPVSPNSPDNTAPVTDNHVFPTPHVHHTARERRPPSLSWVQIPLISNSASPLNPMRQKAEKEAETNRLRSSCTLDRRHECCQWHDLVFENVFTLSDDSRD